MPGLKILISGERKKPAWITSRKADSATDATTSVFHHFSLMTLQRILFTVSNQKKSIETWSSTLKVGGVLGWGGPGMDRGMIFIFLGGAGWFQWFVYIFVDPYTWGNDSKVWGIFVQMGWKHQKGFYWSDGLGWVIWVRLHLPKCMRWDLIISYSNEWR